MTSRTIHVVAAASTRSTTTQVKPRDRYNFGVGGDLLFTPRGGDAATDPHVYFDDEWFASDDCSACDLELKADLEAVERVEKAYGVRGHIAARPSRGHDS